MKYFRTFLCLSLLLGVVYSKQAQAQIPPKVKAYLVMCAYGTVGGSLLGFASLAFHNNSRAIAQGASLGLYAGMIFGGYVLASHKPGGSGEMYPPEEGGPFMDPTMTPQDFGPGGTPPGYPPAEQPAPSGGFFGFGASTRTLELYEHYASNYKSERGSLTSPPLYINFVNMSF